MFTQCVQDVEECIILLHCCLAGRRWCVIVVEWRILLHPSLLGRCLKLGSVTPASMEKLASRIEEGGFSESIFSTSSCGHHSGGFISALRSVIGGALKTPPSPLPWGIRSISPSGMVGRPAG